ncbi:hypothetical protein [Acinetobacter gerneri]|uniref:SMODS and SLOG-associating 2TM effector domain-containing protein n=1 Tax=Acinetobacter gerneri DSM 14967 = CIP 107464 = MTCC 9824 TaxID=1120926 RepID=N8ZNF3_9GAMM|nr:hypothetical protein [Acinetobacter gerneri]ENV33015.1 hypothetical protein F960_02737 [Acinetobacter gerneri DSM 14967 = CIP 107464 = MTCC 9824]EPR80213.1 hypothetical protein L289_0901 [Acinetobacter gerneri DSM 14967 = CIP 107464 = MTCC 9824]
MSYDTEKYKALFDYQKVQYDDERSRYSKLEDKSSKYLTSLTIVITAYTIIVGKFLSISNENINCLLFAIIVFFICFTFLMFCFAWLSIFKSLKLRETSKMPSDKELIEMFDNYPLASVYIYLSNLYDEGVVNYRNINADKSESMLEGYTEIKVAMLSFVITIFLIFLTMVATK